MIFACSGAADVGEIADGVARKLSAEGKGRMFCLAGVGGRVPPILGVVQAADDVLVIDGCGLDCAKRCLEEAGFSAFRHLRVTDLGCEKGSSPLTEETVARIAAAAEEPL